MGAVRVAYTLEQCWHRVPGGTGVAAMRVAEAMVGEHDVTLLGVAGRHKHVPSEPWSPPVPARSIEIPVHANNRVTVVHDKLLTVGAFVARFGEPSRDIANADERLSIRVTK